MKLEPIWVMLRMVFLVGIFIACCFFAHGQNKQGNIWYFGQNAGVDFNSGSPIALTNGALNTLEGCSTISDTAGNLLFYTDGLNVYNQLHNLMPNGTGLAGGSSSSQSALIVPYPGNTNLYYIFTVPEAWGSTDFKYSVVDMTLNGGFGDVINKNTLLFSGMVSEKLAATYHANGHDVWVAIHDIDSTFYSFLVTSTGINAPVVSSVGNIYSGLSRCGCMKFSPGGNKIASVLRASVQLDIIDFDKLTGIFSNPFTFTPPPTLNRGYGVEFSSTGSTLYYCCGIGAGSTDIYQLDMTAGPPNAIIASATVIVSFAGLLGALQLAPDNKIYYACFNSHWLGVINYPDSIGVLSNALNNGVFLGTGNDQIGLPSFISNWFINLNSPIVNLSSTDTTFCEKHCIDFYDLSTNNPTSWQWFFPGADSSTSSLQNPTNICYNQYGSFDVTLIACNAAGCDTLVLSNFINVLPLPSPVITTSLDTLYSSPAVTYQWWSVSSGMITGATNSYYVPAQSGNYFVIVTDSLGCPGISDTITITVLAPAVNLMSSDTTFCEKHCIDFYDLSTNNPTSWQWFFPGSDSLTSTQQNPTNICYNQYGSFDVTLIACNAAGCDTLVLPGFINEYQTLTPTITQSNDTLFSSPGVAYQWWSVDSGIITGANNSYYIPTQGGSYYVMVKDTNGCEGASNTIVITSVKEWSVVSGQLSIVPNPNEGSFTITLNENIGKDFSLHIYNSLGQTIYKSQQTIVNGHSSMVTLPNLAKGLYTVELITSDKVYRQKFIIATLPK